MELVHVKQWGREQPIVVRSFAQTVVAYYDACLELRDLVRSGCGNKNV